MPALLPILRQDAINRWREFLPKVPAYGADRNHVFRGHPNVSRLSAALRYRTLLEDEIVEQTLAEHGFEAAQKWLQEVCWRRYWKGWLERRPQIWRHWRDRVRALPLELPAVQWDRAQAVMSGQSGVGCMDAMAHELLETGYLHNHARMWWASFWIHVEGLPWELGADFFFRELLDADPASNTLSWRWVAGLQTVGKKYLVRLSNIEKYAPHYLVENPLGRERLDDCEAKAEGISDSANRSALALTTFPEFLSSDTRRVGLWIHPDDLSPEQGPLERLEPVCVAACVNDLIYRDHYALSERRIESVHAVLQDGLNRARAHYRCPVERLETGDPASALLEWAQRHELEQVLALAPMVGPIADLLGRLRRRLEGTGIRLTLIRRPSDAFAFSLADAGFFPFWEKMSRHLVGVGSR